MRPALRSALRFGLVSGVVVALDQGSKLWVRAQPGLGRRPRAVLGDWLAWVHVENRGAAFGVFADSAHRQLLFALVAVLMLGGALWAVRRLHRELPRVPEFMGLLAGGGLGNSIDRFGRGSVTDFVLLRAPEGPLRRWLVESLGGYTYPAFNVADVALVSAILLAVPLFLAGEAEDEALPPAPPEKPTLD